MNAFSSERMSSLPQDENEEDAPRLMNYNKDGSHSSQQGSRFEQPQRGSGGNDFELGEGPEGRTPNTALRTNRPPSPQRETSVPVRHLAGS